ncbi:LysM peptidoglycan-binding domain-containing protein [Capillimicrobium parvum]|uniref:LysM domain-containing protein n=1 Tax=Capillimicrobium parvum TaxID=2884022 RepID=A0A9E6Y052_9ACTN|nr:LysM domain-containing protein [Capillimicrobium parvum]UGS37685.1 hypothetical protein DSM104329_04105 [Capillimicrobium parvum]
MARRYAARILAPLAIVAVVVAGYLIYQQYRDNTTGGGSTSTLPAATSPSTTTGKSKRGSKKHRVRKVYIVKQGDILSTVSEKTDVSVERLQELNPELDPQSLQVGQRLKLVPDAETSKNP